MTASAFALTITLPRRGMRVTQGEPVIGGLHGATRHHFCPHCLSWLFTLPGGDPDFVNVRASALDDHAWFVPFIDFFTEAKLPWAETGAAHNFATGPEDLEYPALVREFAERGARPRSATA